MLPEVEVYVPLGEIIATGVSEDEYMARYAADFCEWAEGYVIKMSPVTFNHAELTNYLYILLRVFCNCAQLGGW